jgi:hypothetical protein
MACAVAVFVSESWAGIVPPPWDPTSPNQTFQVWTFQNPSAPTLPDAFDNPNGVPQMLEPQGPIYLPNNPLIPVPGTGVWCMTFDQSLEFFVPNYGLPDVPKEIFISIKFAIPSAGAGVPRAGVVGVDGSPGVPCGPVYTIEPVPGLPGVSQIHYGLCLPNCFPFRASITIPMQPGVIGYIEQVVIQTRCVPSPGSAAFMLMGVGLAWRRRR